MRLGTWARPARWCSKGFLIWDHVCAAYSLCQHMVLEAKGSKPERPPTVIQGCPPSAYLVCLAPTIVPVPARVRVLQQRCTGRAAHGTAVWPYVSSVHQLLNLLSLQSAKLAASAGIGAALHRMCADRTVLLKNAKLGTPEAHRTDPA